MVVPSDYAAPSGGFGAMGVGAAPFGSGPAPSELAGTPAVADWCARGSRWLISPFRGKARMEALLCVFLDELQEVEAALADLREIRALENSEGAQLDEIGRSLGLAREDLPSPSVGNATYRNYLRAKISADRSSSSPRDMLEVLRQLMSGVGDATLTEDYPATAYYESDRPLTYEEGKTYAQLGRAARPTAVEYFFRYEPAGETILEFDNASLGFGSSMVEDDPGERGAS